MKMNLTILIGWAVRITGAFIVLAVVLDVAKRFQN
jgi:hypothetical protein